MADVVKMEKARLLKLIATGAGESFFIILSVLKAFKCSLSSGLLLFSEKLRSNLECRNKTNTNEKSKSHCPAQGQERLCGWLKRYVTIISYKQIF